MNKKQFLAMSLPYGLKVLHDKHVYEIGCIGIDMVSYKDGQGFGVNSHFISYLKPILHPLSDITKEIEHNGERFIPVLKLLEANCFDINENPLALMEEYKDIFLDIDLLTLSDALLLIKWHFDICCLIEKGEAIDVNSLSENPYK